MTGSGRHADFNFHGRVKPGDRIRFVSPANMPDRQRAFARARALSDLGFKVDFGEHAFAKHGPFAGIDEQRLGDLNAALCDPDIRAIFATRGGKGSYRIADQLDFGAARSQTACRLQRYRRFASIPVSTLPDHQYSRQSF